VIDFKPTIRARQEAWIARRRDFHQHPELSFQEVRTAGIVAGELTRLGLEVQAGIGKTGVIAVLEGESDGPTILVRADMDALPIQEENQVDFASETPGVMHACGHDGHTAVALAVAELMSEHRGKIAGRIKFIFQPAEEIGLGADAMIKDGALLDPVPDITLGLHFWNEVPVGTVALTDGPMMAASGDITIQVHGKGGHGALPHEAHDPVVASAQIITALQTIVSSNVRPTDVAVISITQVHGGDAFNVIPSMVTMRGTIRAMRREVIELLSKRMREIVNGVATSLGCTADIEVKDLTLPVINSAVVNNKLRQVFAEVAPDVKLTQYQTMAAEDVSYFLNAAPGTFFFVGAANPEKGLDYPHHHPRFNFDDEAAIPLAVELMASAVASYVIQD
jgi:amidohydrolase